MRYAITTVLLYHSLSQITSIKFEGNIEFETKLWNDRQLALRNNDNKNVETAENTDTEGAIEVKKISVENAKLKKVITELTDDVSDNEHKIHNVPSKTAKNSDTDDKYIGTEERKVYAENTKSKFKNVVTKSTDEVSNNELRIKNDLSKNVDRSKLKGKRKSQRGRITFETIKTERKPTTSKTKTKQMTSKTSKKNKTDTLRVKVITRETRNINQNDTVEHEVVHGSNKVSNANLRINKQIDTSIKPHRVQEDSNIMNLAAVALKKALELFKTLRSKIDGIKRRAFLNAMAKSYKKIFLNYLKNIEDLLIKTRSDSQNIISRTIQTSCRMLKQFSYSFREHISKEGMEANAVTVFNQAVDEYSAELYKHACKVYGFCEENKFSSLVYNIVDRATAYLSNDDFTKIGTVLVNSLNGRKSEAWPGLDNVAKYLENLKGTPYLKRVFLNVRNMLDVKDKPLDVRGHDKGTIYRAGVVKELIDILDEAVPPSEENKRAWAELRKGLEESGGKSPNILKLLQKFSSYALDLGSTLSPKTKTSLINIYRNFFNY